MVAQSSETLHQRPLDLRSREKLIDTAQPIKDPSQETLPDVDPFSTLGNSVSRGRIYGMTKRGFLYQNPLLHIVNKKKVYYFHSH